MNQQQKPFKIPWLTMMSVLMLIAQAVLSHFNIKIDAPVVNEIITAVCGLLAVAGIVAPRADEGEASEEYADTTEKDEGTAENGGDVTEKDEDTTDKKDE